MASIYKRTRDRSKRVTPYYITWTDHLGRRRNTKGFTDKAMTEQLAHKLEHETMLRKRGIIDPVAESLAAAQSRPITEHVNEFERHLTHRSTTQKHVKLTLSRIRAILTHCQFHKLADVSKAKIQEHLSKLRDDKKIGNRTTNHYVQAFDAFGRWLADDGRVAANPVAGLGRLNTEVDVRHERRALSREEMTKLIETAEMSEKPIQGYTGPQRARAYYFSFMTGLRRKEMASLTASSFRLDVDTPTLSVAAACSKHRREDILPLHPELVEKLRLWFAEIAPGDKLFPRLDRKKTWLMVKKDLETAGIPYQTADGIADFHAAGRHSHVTELFRCGGTPTEVRELARHTDIRMTMRYTHIGLTDQARAVARLQPPTTPPKPAVTQTANGESWHRSGTAPDDSSCHSTSPTVNSAGENTTPQKRVKPSQAGLCDAVGHPVAPDDAKAKNWRRRESNLRLGVAVRFLLSTYAHRSLHKFAADDLAPAA